MQVDTRCGNRSSINPGAPAVMPASIVADEKIHPCLIGGLYISRHIVPIENSVTNVTKPELHDFSKRMAVDSTFG